MMILSDLPPEHQVAGIALATAVMAIGYLAVRPKNDTCLKPTEWQKYKLTDKIVVSPNTAIYRFALPGKRKLGLPIGQHISVQAEIDGKLVQRSYTPISSDDDRGHFELMIKSYPQGNVSKWMGELKVGDWVNIKGPKGQMHYSPGLAREIGMIAGGTGITPMLQIIRAALKDPKDNTKLSLIYANVKPNDILLKKSLDDLADKYPEQFKVYYVLNEPPEKWEGGKGFVTADMIKERLPSPNDNNKVLLCGPPPMINAMKKALVELKFKEPRTVSKMEDQVFSF